MNFRGTAYKHRALFGYLFLLTVAVVTIQLHHIQQTGEIERSADRLCDRLAVVAANQRQVLLSIRTVVPARYKMEISKALDRIPNINCERR